MDRIRVRPDLKQRLAESFETAITLTDGLAIITVVGVSLGVILWFVQAL